MTNDETQPGAGGDSLIAQRPLASFLLRSAAARVLGGAISIGIAWAFALTWGDATHAVTAYIQFGLMVTAGVVRGALLGLLTAPAVARLLPDADLEVFVRNTSLLAGFAMVVACLPAALLWLYPGTTYASSAGTDHTFALLSYALIIGPAQWWAFRQYPKAWWYIAASIVAQLVGLLLDAALQAARFGVGFDSFTETAMHLAGSGVIAFVIALPTGMALLRIARFNGTSSESERGLVLR